MICLSLFCLNFVPQRIRGPSRYIPTCIKQSNLLEVIICQVEVKEIDVLNHPFLVGCLGDNDNAVLNQELQGHLCRCLAVFLADIRQRLVPEDAVLYGPTIGIFSPLFKTLYSIICLRLYLFYHLGRYTANDGFTRCHVISKFLSPLSAAFMYHSKAISRLTFTPVPRS